MGLPEISQKATIVRSCYDIACTNNVVEFLSELGCRWVSYPIILPYQDITFLIRGLDKQSLLSQQLPSIQFCHFHFAQGNFTIYTLIICENNAITLLAFSLHKKYVFAFFVCGHCFTKQKLDKMINVVAGWSMNTSAEDLFSEKEGLK